jgi:ClpP class serine protease
LAALSLALGVIQKGQGGLSITDRIGVVPVEGIISQSDEIIEQLNGFADDDTVRAVVLRVESPGGGVAPSQEIYRAVRELRKKEEGRGLPGLGRCPRAVIWSPWRRTASSPIPAP